MRLPSLWLRLCYCLVISSSSLVGGDALGDVLRGTGGMASVSAFSAQYKMQKSNLVLVTAALDHELRSRWAVRGLYFTTQQSTFSGYTLGVSYSSRPSRIDNGALTHNGDREVQTYPKWLFQGSAGVGIFRYFSTLQRAAPRIGQNPLASVDAQLYGVALGAGAQRFLSETYAIGIDAVNLSAIAAGFAVNSVSLSLSLNVYY